MAGRDLQLGPGWTRPEGQDVWSRSLADGYRLWLRGSPGAGPSTPLLWVLDAASLFPLVSTALDWLTRRPDASGVTPLLLAGIDHDRPDRDRRFNDFSFGPPADPAGQVGNVAAGGGAAFAALLCGEAHTFVTDATGGECGRPQLLLGHSMAGQFALRLLAEMPGQFAVTGAISPSIWWNRAALEASLAGLVGRGQSVFLAAGSLEEPADAMTEPEQRRKDRAMVGNVERAAAILRRALAPARVEQVTAEDEMHSSALVATLPRFLRFASAQIFRT